jgi:hypothetical protein
MSDHAIGGHGHPIPPERPNQPILGHRPGDVAGVRISQSARARLDGDRDGRISGHELDHGLQTGIVRYQDSVVVPTGRSPQVVPLVDDQPDAVKLPSPGSARRQAAPPKVQTGPSEAEVKALRQDLQRVVRDSYNPPPIETDDAQTKALREDIRGIMRDGH